MGWGGNNPEWQQAEGLLEVLCEQCYSSLLLSQGRKIYIKRAAFGSRLNAEISYWIFFTDAQATSPVKLQPFS